jgi:hypothetical protein
VELGITDALQKHISLQVVAPKPVSQQKLDFEYSRPRWLRECLAETMGVFIYVFPGIAAVASLTFGGGEATTGSILQIGLAFALGISFAISMSSNALLVSFFVLITTPCCSLPM